MLDELQVYGIDGLFHNIVKRSKIMSGRYGVLVKGGDLNSNNVLSGLEFPQDNFPGVFVLPPLSEIKDASVMNSEWECFYFRLFFMCTTYYTGDNQIKFNDPNTNTSLHTVMQDWQDMKTVAINFMNALMKAQVELRGQFRLGQRNPWKIVRLSKMQNQNISGVMLQFEGEIPTGCTFTDIPV